MADTVFSRASAIAQRFKKAIAATGLVLSPDGAERYDVTAAPSLTAGAGAPTEAGPNGSLYLRTDGTDGDDSLYMRIAGAWVALQGETA